MSVQAPPSPQCGAHLHLDPLGGIAGDMFAAALLDLDPSLGAGLLSLLRSAGLADDVTVSQIDHNDGILQGRRFIVDDPRERAPRRGAGAFVFQASSSAHSGAGHHPFVEICRRIVDSALSAGARTRALDIVTRLARAEGAVHGISDVNDVVFHEVGAADSVADVVTAAVLLDELTQRHGSLTVTISSLPLGSGRVQTAHGELPVPAPATLALLLGHVVHDDGRPGERVTPTGAAIVAHLVPCPADNQRRPAGRVIGTGVGFGTRTFKGLSNIVRVTLTASATTTTTTTTTTTPPLGWDLEAVLEISCDIDDMTGEELAVAADRLRSVDGVVDVVSLPCFMKKGRPATRLAVVCRPQARAEATRGLFTSTTTLGVRVVAAERALLPRTLSTQLDARVKRALRPEGVTFKADVDDVVRSSLAEQRAARRQREDLAAAQED